MQSVTAAPQSSPQKAEQSDILTAEANPAQPSSQRVKKTGTDPSCRRDAQSAILRANGEASRAEGLRGNPRINPSQQLLTYQYLQTLPKLAEGDANKLWFIPTELGDALRGWATHSAPCPHPTWRRTEEPAAAAPRATAGIRKLRHQQLNAKSNAKRRELQNRRINTTTLGGWRLLPI